MSETCSVSWDPNFRRADQRETKVKKCVSSMAPSALLWSAVGLLVQFEQIHSDLSQIGLP